MPRWSMSRIREETRRQQSFAAAVTHAIGITGGAITSDGIILAGTFAVLGIAGDSGQMSAAPTRHTVSAAGPATPPGT
jgi:MMPL family protein